MWNVSIGNTFEYLITIKDTNTSPYYESYEDLAYSDFNGTTIIVEIISLPDLPTAVNSSLLIDSLLSVIKTKMRFPNGSEIPGNIVSFLNPVLSLSFLPTGVWDAFETLLPRTYNTTFTPYPYSSQYFARTSDAYNIGYYHWHIDSGGVYEGNVTHITGIPFIVYRQWDSLSDSLPETFVVATLI